VKRLDGRGRDCTFDLVRELREIAEGQRRLRHVDGDHVANRLAHRERIEQRKAVSVLIDERREPIHHLETVARRHVAPATGCKGATARCHGDVDIHGGACRNLAQGLGIRGVNDGEAISTPRDMLAVDEMAGRVAQAGGHAMPVCS
jgi:hypothetical protein